MALWGPIFGHVLLSFPTGRLATPGRRRLVAASYVLIPLSTLPALLVSDSDEVITDCVGECPRNVLLISHDESLGQVALALGAALTLGLCLAAVVMLVRQWRAAGAPERRSLVPLFASGGATLALVAAYAVTLAERCCGWRSWSSPRRRSRSWPGSRAPTCRARAVCAA